MSEVVPFPLSRRRPLVNRCAAKMQALSPVTAEKHLRETLRVQIETMCRRGIRPELIGREVASFGTAVRSALCRSRRSDGAA